MGGAREPLISRIVGGLKQMTVEPIVFFAMFGYMVRGVTFQNLLIDKSCRILLDYSKEVCDDLDNDNNIKQQAASVAEGNNLYVLFIMLSTIPAVIMATFLGPWSDKYTRRYPLLISVVGLTLDFTIQAVITTSESSSPYLLLASSCFAGFSGGLIIVMSSSYSYLSDITDEKSRPTRYAVLEFFTILAQPMGSFIGGQVFAASGTFAVMVIAAVSFGVALLFVVFVLKETKKRHEDLTTRDMFRDLFKLEHMKSSIKTFTQPRPGNLRKQIWLLVFVSFVIKVIYIGAMGINFQFTKVMYGWSVTLFSNANTVFTLVQAVATVTLVPLLNKRLLLHEAAVGLVGILSLMAKMVILAVAFQQGFVYYAWLCGCLHACGSIAVRSRLSKLVSRQELGRAFSLVATCEALTPVLGSIIMTQVMNASITFYPGLPFAVSAVLLVPPAAIFYWMMNMPTMSFSQYQEDETNRRMKELEDVTAANFM